MRSRIVRGKILKRAILATAALLAVRLFFVQQLIAAFLIFSVLFACVAIVALILLALDFAWRTALAKTEAYAIVLGRSLRHGRELANTSVVTNMLTPVPANRIAPHEQETYGVRLQLTQKMPLRLSIAADKEPAIVGGSFYATPPASRPRRLATARL
jgi:hypothetical protein